MDEVTCIQSNKKMDWMLVFYMLTIKHDIPDESWVYIEGGNFPDIQIGNEKLNAKYIQLE
ncbi:MAG: hypothetical protein WC877_00605 [Dehalococcoidales bacterium]|jgi:hypothetical protein